MKPNAILILCISFFTACNGQSSTAENGKSEDHTKDDSFGDTVQQTGKNIMVVYQDLKNDSWFGSWETGLYRYDGKTMVNYTSEHGLPDHRIEEIK